MTATRHDALRSARPLPEYNQQPTQAALCAATIHGRLDGYAAAIAPPSSHAAMSHGRRDERTIVMTGNDIESRSPWLTPPCHHPAPPPLSDSRTATTRRGKCKLGCTTHECARQFREIKCRTRCQVVCF